MVARQHEVLLEEAEVALRVAEVAGAAVGLVLRERNQPTKMILMRYQRFLLSVRLTVRSLIPTLDRILRRQKRTSMMTCRLTWYAIQDIVEVDCKAARDAQVEAAITD